MKEYGRRTPAPAGMGGVSRHKTTILCIVGSGGFAANGRHDFVPHMSAEP